MWSPSSAESVSTVIGDLPSKTWAASSARTSCCSKSGRGVSASFTWPHRSTRPASRRPQDHQARHGYGAGRRPLRIGAAGVGFDGSSQHRQGAGRRRDRSGHPYFVMELVKGVPITDYCDQNRLPPRNVSSCLSTCATPFSMRTTKVSSIATSSRRNVLVASDDGRPSSR